jgi:hypothetical protein
MLAINWCSPSAKDNCRPHVSFIGGVGGELEAFDTAGDAFLALLPVRLPVTSEAASFLNSTPRDSFSPS